MVLARRPRPPTREAELAVYQPRADYSALLLTLLKDACLRPIVCSNARRTDGNEAQILSALPAGSREEECVRQIDLAVAIDADTQWALKNFAAVARRRRPTSNQL